MVPETKGTPNRSRALDGVKAVEGYNVKLFAAPPDISYPTCLAATLDGTLFVGVDLNGSLGSKPGRGKIVRCIDSDGDGTSDKFNTFCNVDSPRGLWWDGHRTLYVLHPPCITAYHDDDGDGVADRSEDVVTGLGFDLKTRGADHTTNGFRYAIDGFFYIAVGDYGAVQARGKDGRTLQLHGGGVVRVRPDGTGLELVASGLRNIYDVGVSPTLDLFTRDNTNDGDGWDVRLSHIHSTGRYGYPSLYQHFPDDLIKPLADYGGGSPTGTLFLDEPGWGPGNRGMLLTCEWGRSAVYRHPLTSDGATFKAGQEKLLDIPRPTDIDVDGSGRLYVSSWKDGGFDFSKPDIGFVVRVTPTDWKPVPIPNLKKADAAALVGHLKSRSASVRSYAQREILRRNEPGRYAELLKPLVAVSPAYGLETRVAALFTLRIVAGTAANEFIQSQYSQPELREFVLRALSDPPEERKSLPLSLVKDALASTDPRVRAQAVIASARSGNHDLAVPLVKLLADPDPIVRHLAVNAMGTLHAGDVCLQALDSADRVTTPGLLRALQGIHELPVVDGLITRLALSKDEAKGRGITIALARLEYQEADWDGKWWGTRPDTTGPYYKPVTWAGSPRIAAVLLDLVRKADADELKWLLPELLRHRIELPEIIESLVTSAKRDSGLRRIVVEVMSARPTPPTAVVPVFAAVAGDPAEPASLRAAALRGLAKLNRDQTAREALVKTLTASDSLPAELEAVWVEFARDGKRVSEYENYVKLSADADPRKRELAYAVIASIADRNLGEPKARQAANGQVANAWANPATALPLLKAITRLELTSFAPQLRKLTASPDAALAAAAQATMTGLKLDATATQLPVVSALKYEEILAGAQKIPGSAELGAKLFGRIGCANCHTVSASEPLKGPLLAGVRTKYSRAEVLESILKPSEKIAQGFETVSFVTADGKTIAGFVVRESGQEVEIRDGTGATTVIKKDDIEVRRPNKLSTMPEKLADDLTVPELASVLAYLESLKGK